MIYSPRQKKQQGFVLIVTMILLMVVSLLAVGGMRVSVMGERMAGNAMDRNLAKLAAEQAITQGLAKLQANSTVCLDTGCVNTNTVGTGVAIASATMPSVWSPTDSVDVTKELVAAGGQKSSAKYLINWLNNVAFTPALSSKSTCKAYSVMGRGEGKNSASVVVLQTIAYVCPTD
ncbi:pilus assembly PilX family protein [Rhodoferax saidenbachensis]|uniref:Uncharacterized protein n=1 Tax=Rhodoferax saidenbachensis TaxID=1484693 RepID=A0A1P8KB82_9BURK|nr:PilX N-terminal domain-containing pilus assembly protein [Rhodoferax saidenbachensis]APW43225.1 hypothetical protein RS694_12285 [Rhodoferax saidenbachensis]